MSDIKYRQEVGFPRYAVELDWLLSPLNLLEDGPSLMSAAIIALGTDARAAADDVLPNPDDTDRRGWWGDTDAAEIWGGWPVGSRLWLLSRAKITGPLAGEGGTVERAELYAAEAMKPFVDARIASNVDAVAERIDRQRIDVGVTLFRGPEPAVELRYAELWEELGGQ